MSEILAGPFWISVLEIIVINILLSGDNAVVIALACRNLPPQQRRVAVAGGVAGAVIARVVLTAFAAALLQLPWLKLVGAVLLAWIGAQLIASDTDGEPEVAADSRLSRAIWTVVTADVIMSLDNVVGVAAAAHGSFPLLVFGLVVSIPIVVLGSQLVMRLLEKLPVLVIAGGGLLGWIAGEMAIGDVVVARLLSGREWVDHLAPALGFALVVATGLALRRRGRTERAP